MTTLHFTADFDLPPEIVWDALVDSDLVSGWLAEADIDTRVGGRFDLRWTQFGTRTVGEITELIDLELLVVDTDSFGVTSFALEAVAGGTRGFGTRLRVTMDALVDQHFSAPLSAIWQISLEQLEGLLRGHPVNWATWRVDHAARWAELTAQETRQN